MSTTKKPTNPRFEVYQSLPESFPEWRWRLLARNGEIIASGESYTSEKDARRAVKAVKRAIHAILLREDEEAGIEWMPVVKGTKKQARKAAKAAKR